MAAVLVSWLPQPTLKDRFEAAREVLVEGFGHHRRPGRTSQGFFEALARRSGALLRRLPRLLRRCVQDHAQGLGRWKQDGWTVFAVDGTRVECPRTLGNQEQLKCAGRDKTGPQLQLTALRLLNTGLLWDWRIGPGVEPEREHLRDMLGALPSEALIVADAGFTGYDLLAAILRAGHHLLIRVGANVRLIEGIEPSSGASPTVHLWPQEVRRAGLRPLRLRVVRVVDGCQTIHLLTDLPLQRLSDRQARLLYRKRWGMEVGFRTLKQTMGHRTMLSRNPDRAMVELHWAMVGLAIMEQMSVRVRRTGAASPAQVQRVLRKAARRAHGRCGRHWLTKALAAAAVDSYVRHGDKSSRDYPRKKTQSPPGQPKLRPATKTELKQYQALMTPKTQHELAA